ncbi:hypothetical protein Dimus_009602 [Dionaea muscipula]
MNRQQEQRHPDHSQKPHKPKPREVSSRFLPSKSKPTPTDAHGISSPNNAPSPVWPKANNKPSATRTHQRPVLGGLGSPFWPRHSAKVWEDECIHLGRQRSFSRSSRFEEQRDCGQENHRSNFGGSMSFRENLQSGQKSSPSSSSSNSLGMVSRRISMNDFDHEFGDVTSGTEYFGSPSMEDDHHVSSSPGRVAQRSGKKVASRYLHNLLAKPRRETPDTKNVDQSGFDNSPNLKKTRIKDAKKESFVVARVKGVEGEVGNIPSWVSPVRERERKEKSMSLFSGLKPPVSPLKTKSVGSLLSMGLELFKSRKSKLSGSSSSGAGGDGESVHQLRLLQNKLVQWRFANARSEAVNRIIDKQAEVRVLCASDSLTNLRSSVLQKKLQLDRERLEMKLMPIVQSQIKSLAAWSDLERQHLQAISTTKDYLHSVICKAPLIEGASADVQSVSIALRHASYLVASIKSMLIAFAPLSMKTALLLSELAEVIIIAKSMLQEFFELASSISILEIEERSLHCALIQLRAQQQQWS